MEQPLNIFYHLLCVNDGVKRFKKTYDKIKKYKLLGSIEKIFVNCVGEQQCEFSKSISHLPKVEVILGKNDKNESETINLMRKFAIDNGGYSLYLHAKGVWRSHEPNVCNECVNSYVDFMEFFLIEKYYHCVELLKEYKSCGCALSKGRHASPHYAGNFWWAQNKYIASLPQCENNRKAPEDFIHPGGGGHKELFKPMFGWPQIFKKILPRDSYESKISY